MKKNLLILFTLALSISLYADIVIYPTTVPTTNNSCSHSAGCPGGYCGYFNYTKTVPQGWGWSPNTNFNVFSATDTNRNNTKVQMGGAYGDNNCNQTSVQMSSPLLSPVYRWTVYFTNSLPTTTNYPLVVHGFNP